MFGMAGAQNTGGLFSGLTNMFQAVRTSFNGAVNSVKQNVAATQATAQASNPVEFGKEVKGAAKDTRDFVRATFETTEGCANYLADYPTYNTWIRTLDESREQLENIQKNAIDNGTIGSVDAVQVVANLNGVDNHVAKKQIRTTAQTQVRQGKRTIARNVAKVETQDVTKVLQTDLANFNAAVAKYITNGRQERDKNQLVTAADKARSTIDTTKGELEAKKQRAINTDPAAEIIYGGSKLRTWLTAGVVLAGAIMFANILEHNTSIFSKLTSAGSDLQSWIATQLNSVVDRAIQQRAQQSFLGRVFGFGTSASTTNS